MLSILKHQEPIQLNLLSYDDTLRKKEDNLLQLLNNNENNRFGTLGYLPLNKIRSITLNYNNRPKNILIYDDLVEAGYYMGIDLAKGYKLNTESYNNINNYNIRKIGQPFQLLLNFNKPKPIIHKWFNSLLYKRKKGKLRHY